MKRALILTTLVVCGLSLFAQEGTQNVGFYVGYANPVLRERKTSDDTKLTQQTQLRGFTVGAAYETTFIKGFGMQMALNYTLGANLGKWENASLITQANKVRNQYTFHSLELPIDWQYKFTIAKETYLILYTGPTIQVGMAFKNNRLSETMTTHGLETGKENIDMYALDRDNDELKDYSRFNILWGVGAGFQYQRYFLRGGYDFGIISPYKDRYYDELEGAQWGRRGRFDQWSIKIGMYLWQF